MNYYLQSPFELTGKTHQPSPLVIVSSLCALVIAPPALVQAQTPAKPNQMIVTISDSPDPVSSSGKLTYQVSVKNDGPAKSQEVEITVILPDGVQFVSCKTSADTSIVRRCLGATGKEVRAFIPEVKAHKTVKLTVVGTAPTVSTDVDLVLSAKAEGENAFKGEATVHTTVLEPWADATMLPSRRSVKLRCGDTLDNNFFQGTEHTLQLEEPLACKGSAPFGLKIARSNITLSLQGKKILVDSATINQAGILVGPSVKNVVVDGVSSAKGSNGIENFDWCLKDEGGNEGLVVKNLRCYKARSAGLKIMSNNVFVSTVKIDSTTQTGTTTQELGGIGIYAHGDNILIKDSIVRRSKQVGILADGVHAGATGYAVTIDGNTESSRIESNYGVGVLFENGPHLLKDTLVSGDGPGSGTSTDGVVIGDSGINNTLEGAVVKRFNGNGIVINATTTVQRSAVETVGLNGVLISSLSSATKLNGNTVKKVEGNGFAIFGNNNILDTNRSERNIGNGLFVSGINNQLSSNSAKQNAGIGFEVTGPDNLFRTNTAEKSISFEWRIVSSNIDQGSNKANKNPISFGSGGGTLTFE